jgi:hypothetical protein
LHGRELPVKYPERQVGSTAAPGRLPTGVVVGAAVLAMGGWMWWQSNKRRRQLAAGVWDDVLSLNRRRK